jgi:hypothetical protein
MRFIVGAPKVTRLRAGHWEFSLNLTLRTRIQFILQLSKKVDQEFMGVMLQAFIESAFYHFMKEQWL